MGWGELSGVTTAEIIRDKRCTFRVRRLLLSVYMEIDGGGEEYFVKGETGSGTVSILEGRRITGRFRDHEVSNIL